MHHRHKMKVELGVHSDFSLLEELSALKKSRSLRDPSTSPSWRSPNMGSLMRKLESENGLDAFSNQASSYCNDASSTLERISLIAENIRHARCNANHAAVVEEERDDASDRAGWIEISLEESKLDTQSAEVKGERGPPLHINRTRPPAKVKGVPMHEKRRVSMRDDGAEGSFRSRIQRPPLGSHSTGKITARIRNIKQGKGQRGKRLYLLASPCSERQKLRAALRHGLSVSSQERWCQQRPVTTMPTMDTACANTDELEISELPQNGNGCGIPWKWSRIHSRGKDILDMAGRSLPCGVPDHVTSKSHKPTYFSHRSSPRETVPATTSEYSDTSLTTDSESLPLLDRMSLFDSGSQSEGVLGGHETEDPHHVIPLGSHVLHRRVSGSDNGHHSSLNQKYMPKRFHDIVGQNLTTQALSNALLQGRVAHMYIFYGPGGTGKTSCARVFAAALNCLSSGEQRPCSSCAGCMATSNFGKAAILKEFHAASNHGVRNIRSLMNDVMSYSSYFRVYVVDECQAFSNQEWNAFLKGVDEAPKNVMFILSTSSLEQLPHTVVSRCQKFLFSKIRESDVISRLKFIAEQERLEVDEEAFKLMASACDGSLRDAEMMLDQLSLLGQKIPLPMVQELMGLIPNEKLLELLDFSLSADTINTVKSLKEFMVSGVEPLNLMSQLACLITSILAGAFPIPKEGGGRKFFRKAELTKDDLERLRQALKSLSEAEKQLRGSADRTTWLTAALLQLAPDQSYLPPSSATGTSVSQSPAGPNGRDESSNRNSSSSRGKSSLDPPSLVKHGPSSTAEGAVNVLSDSSLVSVQSPLPARLGCPPQRKSSRRKSRRSGEASDNGCSKECSSTHDSSSIPEAALLQNTLTNCAGLEEVWQRLLDAVHSNSLRKFLQTHGKLLSVSLYKGFGMAVLEFGQLEHTSRAERSKTSIAHAFQVTLGYPIHIKVQLASGNGEQSTGEDHPCSSDKQWQSEWMSSESPYIVPKASVKHGHNNHRRKSLEVYGAAPVHTLKPPNHSFEMILETGKVAQLKHSPQDKLESAWIHGNGELMRRFSKTDMQNKVSLAFALNQQEGCPERGVVLQNHRTSDVSAWNVSGHRASDFTHTTLQGEHDAADAKLEEENLRLESRSGGLLCWQAPDKGNEKVKQLPQSPKRSGIFLSLCPCANSNHS